MLGLQDKPRKTGYTQTIHMLRSQGEKVSRIARAVNLSRVTVYQILYEATLGTQDAPMSPNTNQPQEQGL